jgi:hypothetical protein
VIRTFRRPPVLLFLTLILGVSGAYAQTAGPRIFFLDLHGGPNTGGQNNQGVFLTIFGNGFGTTQGSSTVTIGGGAVASCPIWGATWLWYQKITCQIGSSAATGTVVVTVGGQGSTCENADANENCNFTVQSGNIYFVSTSGNDSNAGTFTAPFATIPRCYDTMQGGDTCYIENGVVANSVNGHNGCVDANNPNGSSGHFVSLIAYPGATAQIGGPNSPCQYAIRTPAISGDTAFSYTTLSQLTLVGAGGSLNQAVNLVDAHNWRLVGNDISCNGNVGGQAACWETSSNFAFTYGYGNHIHDVGSGGHPGNKTYHMVYFSSAADHIWMAWNSIHDGGCRGIQTNSTGSASMFDIHVHDNTIYNIQCNAINFNTVDPSQGTVEAYNNVVYHAGIGPDPPDGASDYTCLAVPGDTQSGSPGSGAVLVYNNTMYDCSGGTGTNSGQSGFFDIGSQGAGPTSVSIINNVLVSISADAGNYFSSGSNLGNISASGNNNLCNGSYGNCPSQLSTSAVNASPGFVSAGSNFHLLSASSLANGAGAHSGSSSFDHDGLIRPSPPAVGAYEFTSAAAVQRPNPPTHLTVVVQ